MLSRYILLQCGHGEFAVENKGSPLVRSDSSSASMRPRRIRRGEPSICADTLRPSVSLQCGHGEFAVENTSLLDNDASKRSELQCGHGEFAVENVCSSRPRAVAPGLQCGHGEFAVENRT